VEPRLARHRLPDDVGGAVRAAVVDDQRVDVVAGGEHLLDQAGDRLGLVVGRDHDQRPHGSSVVSSGRRGSRRLEGQERYVRESCLKSWDVAADIR
jgi:hypothetical protein